MQVMTRRSFGQASTLAFLAFGFLGSLFTMVGCNVWTEIEQWVPVGITAFESVITLVAPMASPGLNAIAETVKAGFAALAAAVDQYIAAPAADKATLLQKVQLIFEDVSTNLQNFLNAVNIPGANPIVKVVLGLVNIILSTIAGFVNRIGAPAAIASRRLTLAGQSVVVSPVFRTKKSFKHDFNVVCIDNGHPEAQIN